MALVISDEFLVASQLTPNEFLQEIALHLFDSGRLTLDYGAKMAQIDSHNLASSLPPEPHGPDGREFTSEDVPSLMFWHKEKTSSELP